MLLLLLPSARNPAIIAAIIAIIPIGRAPPSDERTDSPDADVPVVLVCVIEGIVVDVVTTVVGLTVVVAVVMALPAVPVPFVLLVLFVFVLFVPGVLLLVCGPHMSSFIVCMIGRYEMPLSEALNVALPMTPSDTVLP